MEKLLLGLLFIALGTFAVLMASFSWRRNRRFVSESLPAQGEVIALREHRCRRVTYAPVVCFTTQLGQAVEFTDEISSSRPGYRVGQRVRVLYHRRDPSDARVTSAYKLYTPETHLRRGRRVLRGGRLRAGLRPRLRPARGVPASAEQFSDRYATCWRALNEV